MNNSFENLEISLIVEDNDINRKKWAKKFVSNKIELKKYLYLLEADKKLATRFIWLVGDICELDPKTVFPVIKDFFIYRNKTKIVNYNRSLAKMFMYCGIPKDIEGEIVNILFNWLLDPNELVTTKNYALIALYNQTTKYPELVSELESVIKDQFDKNAVSFKSTANEILNKLGKKNI